MFFTAIHQMMTEGVDLTLVIRKANGQLTVSLLPKSNGLKDEAQNHRAELSGHKGRGKSGGNFRVLFRRHTRTAGCGHHAANIRAHHPVVREGG